MGETNTPLDLWAAVARAQAAIERHDAAAAIAVLQAALDREPNFAPALSSLSEAYWLAGRPHDALGPARRAVAIQPPNPNFRLVLAQLCIWLGLFDEARLQLAPLLAEDCVHDIDLRAKAFGYLADLHVARGEPAAADPAFRRALDLAPASAPVHMAYGMNLLRQGQFAEGWREYEWRMRVPFLRPRDKPIPEDGRAGQPWTGQDIAGRTLLIYDDQGFGDAIQFFRYLGLLRRRAPRQIVWRSFLALVPLFAANAPPLVRVVARVPADFAADFHCTSTSLPLQFGTELGNIPDAVPYLRAPVESAAPVLRRSGRLDVGLAWAGDRQHLRDHLRSIPAADFLQLATLPGIGFHSLQREVRDEDLPALEAHPGVSRVGERLHDWAETASVLTQLDLVVTVDTGVAHLAGAMGRPVWLLLPLAPDWRWLSRRNDSPWYPSIRLFRAGADGWAPVLRRVRKALQRMSR
jgi:tetratricopeptide (TPR) repeat protein